MSETPETETPEPDYDRVAHYKALVESVLATSSRSRERCNETAARALAGLKHDFPEISDETLFTILVELGMIVSTLAGEPVARISSTLDFMFSNLTLSAAALIGAYDLGDIESHMRNLDEILEERRKAMGDDTSAPDTGPVPGMYL